MSATMKQWLGLYFCGRLGLNLRAFEFVVAGGHGGVAGTAIGVAGGSCSSATNSQSSLPKKTIDCGSTCEARCQLSKRPKLCKRACGSCCFRCQCVPPGTSGKADSCPSYATMTTRNNKLKCP
ncbi:hypothetical protein NE237_018167 [Protea cynaroides]|uniref:Uncharacterized protein n=1 Tax=Protea cynaroides TaxID=273540 RepID=A0A9Q0K9E1_9MAGN|nr:hypothetical protein NE237_018167 [Protea cynaroides]